MQHKQAIVQNGLTPQQNAAMMAGCKGSACRENNRQLIALQLMVMCAVAAAYFLSHSATPQEIIAACEGGGVSVFNSMLIAWRMRRAEKHSLSSAQLQLWLLYSYVAERFFLVMVVLGVLMAKSHSPLSVLSGFVVGQAGMFVARLCVDRLQQK